MLYFAYGSNMLTTRLQARVPSAEPLTTATLPGRRLRFHKRSHDASGKCNIAPVADSNAEVHGVLFEVAPSGLSALDEAEQRGRGYERNEVTLYTPSSTVVAFTYEAQQAYVDDALLPYDWYHGVVVAGARAHDLPAAYVTEIESIPSYPDPDDQRRQKHAALLQKAGFSLLTD